MQNRFFGMLATIMMCGAVMTGLTACSNEDNNDGNVKEKQVATTTVMLRRSRWPCFCPTIRVLTVGALT